MKISSTLISSSLSMQTGSDVIVSAPQVVWIAQDQLGNVSMHDLESKLQV